MWKIADSPLDAIIRRLRHSDLRLLNRKRPGWITDEKRPVPKARMSQAPRALAVFP
jgi:hypothetical protein